MKRYSVPNTLAPPNDDASSRPLLLEFQEASLPVRLPLHPHPLHLEPLALWIERIAAEYGARYRPFCRLWLGLHYSELVEFNRQPSPVHLSKIAHDTRVPICRLLQMTIPAVLAGLQIELGVGIGDHQREVNHWLTENIANGGRSREYWDALEFWQRERQHRLRTNSVA